LVPRFRAAGLGAGIGHLGDVRGVVRWWGHGAQLVAADVASRGWLVVAQAAYEPRGVVVVGDPSMY
jgi:hypothetical protein